MSEECIITTEEGKTLPIAELIRRMENKEKGGEYERLGKEEVKKQRKCLKRRAVRSAYMPPVFSPEYTEVRYLTEEEIRKEYKMPVKEGTVSERGSTIKELIKFLQELEGRKVSTEIIVGKVKRPSKSVSSFLSQLYNASIISRVHMNDNKRKFIWGLNGPYLKGDLDAIISIFNDFVSKKRREQYSDSIKKKKDGVKVEKIEDLIKEDSLEERLEKIETPSSNTLRVVVEGHIKILFGLVE